MSVLDETDKEEEALTDSEAVTEEDWDDCAEDVGAGGAVFFCWVRSILPAIATATRITKTTSIATSPDPLLFFMVINKKDY